MFQVVVKQFGKGKKTARLIETHLGIIIEHSGRRTYYHNGEEARHNFKKMEEAYKYKRLSQLIPKRRDNSDHGRRLRIAVKTKRIKNFGEDFPIQFNF